MVKITTLESDQHKFESKLYHLLPIWFWTGDNLRISVRRALGPAHRLDRKTEGIALKPSFHTKHIFLT